MLINSLHLPDPPPGKPPAYTIVTEWFTLQEVPSQVLDMLGVILMSLPIPRKYTDPVINTIMAQATDQNQAYAQQYARSVAQANFENVAPDYSRPVS